MNTYKLLIVEDDITLQGLLALELARQGISYDRVASAEDALMMLTSMDYTGVIVDLTLPGMDGWTFIETFHRNPRTAAIPCVAITCYHVTELDAVTLDVGFAAYFRKPLNIRAFVHQIQRVFNGSVLDKGCC